MWWVRALPALMLAVLLAPPAYASVVVQDTLSYGTSTYYLLAHEDNGPLYWGEAEDYSREVLGGHLVTLDDGEENTAVSQWVYGKWDGDYATVWQVFAWIGFTDDRAEGQWEWASGEPATYTNWGPPPNNCVYQNQGHDGLVHPGDDPGDEDYAVTNWLWHGGGIGKWNDLGDWYNDVSTPDDPYRVVYAVAERPVPELPPALLVAGLPLAGLGRRRLRRWV